VPSANNTPDPRAISAALGVELSADLVVLALPNNPLCREDCPGLCPECGVPLDELPADHGHEQLDPRWAALSQMNTKTEE